MTGKEKVEEIRRRTDNEGTETWSVTLFEARTDRDFLLSLLDQRSKELELCQGFLREEKEQNERALIGLASNERELDTSVEVVRDLQKKIDDAEAACESGRCRYIQAAQAEVWDEAARELKSNRPEVLVGLIKLFEMKAAKLRGGKHG